MNNATLDRTTPTAPVHQHTSTTRTVALLALTLGLLVAAIALIMTWDVGARPADPAPPDPVGPPPAYQPGGSVYEQQVPNFTHWALVYGPGGSIYKSQVPSAAR